MLFSYKLKKSLIIVSFIALVLHFIIGLSQLHTLLSLIGFLATNLAFRSFNYLKPLRHLLICLCFIGVSDFLIPEALALILCLLLLYLIKDYFIRNKPHLLLILPLSSLLALVDWHLALIPFCFCLLFFKQKKDTVWLILGFFIIPILLTFNLIDLGLNYNFLLTVKNSFQLPWFFKQNVYIPMLYSPISLVLFLLLAFYLILNQAESNLFNDNLLKALFLATCLIFLISETGILSKAYIFLISLSLSLSLFNENNLKAIRQLNSFQKLVFTICLAFLLIPFFSLN